MNCDFSLGSALYLFGQPFVRPSGSRDADTIATKDADRADGEGDLTPKRSLVWTQVFTCGDCIIVVIIISFSFILFGKKK